MGMELKTTDDPEYFEIHDEVGKIGHLHYVAPDPEDATEGWIASFDMFNGIWRQTAFLPTAAEAASAAWPLYEQLVEDRRRVAKFHRNRPTTIISTPMGGQPPK